MKNKNSWGKGGKGGEGEEVFFIIFIVKLLGAFSVLCEFCLTLTSCEKLGHNWLSLGISK